MLIHDVISHHLLISMCQCVQFRSSFIFIFVFLIVCWCQKWLAKESKNVTCKYFITLHWRNVWKGAVKFPWNLENLSLNFPWTLTFFSIGFHEILLVFLHELGWSLVVWSWLYYTNRPSIFHSSARQYIPIDRDSRKSPQKMVKKHGKLLWITKITAKTHNKLQLMLIKDKIFL